MTRSRSAARAQPIRKRFAKPTAKCDTFGVIIHKNMTEIGTLLSIITPNLSHFAVEGQQTNTFFGPCTTLRAKKNHSPNRAQWSANRLEPI